MNLYKAFRSNITVEMDETKIIVVTFDDGQTMSMNASQAAVVAKMLNQVLDSHPSLMVLPSITVRKGATGTEFMEEIANEIKARGLGSSEVE